MKITVLVENTKQGECECEHGLSLMIEYKGDKYLVDTGASGMFAENAKKLGVDLSTIKAGFLSHAHYDHSSGYPEFFESNSTAKIYLQQAAANKCFFKIAGPIKKYIGIPNGILSDYQDRFEYVDGYRDLGNGIYIIPHSTPEIINRAIRTHMCTEIDGKIVYDDFSHEQTVVFEEEDGLVCFNSCSHGGVDVIIEEVKRAFPGKNIKAYCGGFHMMGPLGPTTSSYAKEEVSEVARKLLESSNARFYSGHCTGTIAFDWLKEVMGDRIEAFYSGKVFEC